MITTAGLQQTYSILDISPAVLTTIKYRAILTAQFFAPIFWLLFFNLVFHPYGHYREQQSCRA
jgi:hypothetical protein